MSLEGRNESAGSPAHLRPLACIIGAVGPGYRRGLEAASSLGHAWDATTFARVFGNPRLERASLNVIVRGRFGHGAPHWFIVSNMSNSVVNVSPDVMSGAPVFPVTRAPVQTLFEYLGAGDSIDEFLAGFPSVSRSQVIAFLGRAASLATVDACTVADQGWLGISNGQLLALAKKGLATPIGL